MRRVTTFRPTTDRIYDGGPIILYEYYITLHYITLYYIILHYIYYITLYIILYYNTYQCVIIAYSIQYSNMLYRFVA